MGLLTNRRMGATAEWMRSRTGESQVSETRAVARRVGRIERALVHQLRVPRGIKLEDRDGTTPTVIEFDKDGYIVPRSSDASITMAGNPVRRPNAWDLIAAGGGGGCEAVVKEVTDGTTSVTMTDCDGIIEFQDGTCIDVVVSEPVTGTARVAVAYTGDHYSTVNGDTGSATASGCGDTISLVGGTCISTTAAEGTPDSVTINYDGDHWSSVVTDAGTAAASGCNDSLDVLGGTCIDTRVTGGQVFVDYAGAHYKTINVDVSGPVVADTCDDTLTLNGGTCIETRRTADDTIDIDFTGVAFGTLEADGGETTNPTPGCSETLKILGGNCISTNITGGAFEIDLDAFFWGDVGVTCGSNLPPATCADSLNIQGDGTWTAVHGDGVDTLTVQWCAPAVQGPQPVQEPQWNYQNPDGWLALCLGDPCTGGTIVKVPYWN